MKKLLLLTVLLAFGFYANAYEPHWQPSNAYMSNMNVLGPIQLDGVTLESEAIEVGAFVGDECHGSCFLLNMGGQYNALQTIVGSTGQVITFRLYDHSLGQELEVTCHTTVTFSADALIGFEDPFLISFTTTPYYNVTAAASPADGGTVSGGGLLMEGSNCTLTATANHAYVFSNWTKNGSVVSSNPTYTFTVTEDADYVANFVFNGYVINVEPDYPVSGSVTGGGVFEYGETCTLTAVPNEGFNFSHWAFNGSVISQSNPFAFEVVASLDMVAVFTSDVYIVEVSCNPTTGGTVTGAGSYTEGDVCTLTATPAEGYFFISWMEDGNVVSNDATYSFTVTSHRNLLANFSTTLDYHWTPAYNLFPDNMNVLGPVSLDGELLTSSFYEIGAFCGNQCRGTVFIQNMAGNYLALQTIAGANGDVITFRLYDHESQEELSVTCLSSVIFETNALIGFPPQDFYSIIFVSSLYVGAIANPSAGGTVTGSGMFNPDEVCTLTATPNTGYTFINWMKDGVEVSTDATYSFVVTESGEYVANFALNTYTITVMADPSEAATVTGAGTYTHGSTCTLTATINEGYTFINWTKDGQEVATTPTFSFTAMENATFVANCILNTYEIEAVSNMQGVTVTGAGTYNYGATCTLTAEASSGLSFVNWTENGQQVSESPTYSFTVTANRSLVANFEMSKYWTAEVHQFPDNMNVLGYATLNGVEIGSEYLEIGAFCGEQCRGSEFMFWIDGYQKYCALLTIGGANGDVITFRIYDHIAGEELDATCISFVLFEVNATIGLITDNEQPFQFDFRTLVNVEASVNMTEGGTVSGQGTYPFGTNCTLVATPNLGYSFINWTKDGEEISTDPNFTFTVEEDVSYVANFELSYITQTSQLVTGMTWWCSYVQEETLLTQLENEIGSNGIVIKSQNNGTASYLFGSWFGGLTSIENNLTYMINLREAQEVSVSGLVVKPSEHPVTLDPGWTWIGYPCSEPMPLAAALAEFSPQPGDVLKTQTESSTYMFGGWYGTLQTLTPGVGLMYKSGLSESTVMVYSDGDMRGEPVENAVAEDQHWQGNPHAYAYNMSVMAIVELDGTELRGEQYEVAAFANGECRGSSNLMYIEPIDRYVVFLTLAGDESAELRFGLYNASTGEECLSADEHVVFESNAVVGDLLRPYVISFRQTTGIDAMENSLNVYPNPVNRGETFSIGLTETRMANVKIINAIGVETMRATSVQSPATFKAPEIPGVYTLQVTVGENTFCRKLVVR